MDIFNNIITEQFVGIPMELAFTPDSSSIVISTNECISTPQKPYGWFGRWLDIAIPPMSSRREHFVEIKLFVAAHRDTFEQL